MSRRVSSLADRDVFAVCQRFLERNEAVAKIAEKFQSLAITRQQVYDVIAEGRKRKFVRLSAPRAQDLAGKVKANYELLDSRDVYVLDVGKDPSTAAVASGPAPTKSPAPYSLIDDAGMRELTSVRECLTMEAAVLALEKIKEIAARRRKGATKPQSDDVAVHIGLGAGGTTERFAYHLAGLLRAEPPEHLPNLVFHALSSGFEPKRPMLAPVAFFSHFMAVKLDPRRIDYVGMFCEPLVAAKDYDRVKQNIGVRDAFQEAHKIDIAVTSLSSYNDDHGLFINIVNMVEPQARERLEKAGWRGDVQWRSYSATGPIMEKDIGKNMKRVVTLFELSDFVRLANTPGKHVILIAGPCRKCYVDKSEALKPLITEPSLCVFNHLITDIPTAKGLLD